MATYPKNRRTNKLTLFESNSLISSLYLRYMTFSTGHMRAESFHVRLKFAISLPFPSCTRATMFDGDDGMVLLLLYEAYKTHNELGATPAVTSITYC